MAVNSVTVIGNLGARPQVHALPPGQSVVNLSLATTERFTDRNGGKQQRTEWHRIVVSGSWPRHARSISARAARSMSKDG